MRIGVAREVQAGESRVAISPDAIKRLIAAGHTVFIETGAGKTASFADDALKDAGAETGPFEPQALDILFCVKPPATKTVEAMRKGSAIVGLISPFDNDAFLSACASAGVDAFAMELTPRITRAQVMDALSSQSNLAGYRAVIEGAAVYGKAMPMMMTAAGTVPAAKVFVMGAGVAGLQAIATAKRLGAVVSATDVRPAAKEQVQSLAAKFIAVEDEEFKAAETSGGYAKAMSAEYQAKQAELVAAHIAKQDMVITTALIPGRPAPRLVTKAMIADMKPGSVVVDLAVERGGNVEGIQADTVTVTDNGVSLVGYGNLAGRLASDASALYAKNLTAFLPLITGEDGGYAPNMDDEIVAAMAVVKDGAVRFGKDA